MTMSPSVHIATPSGFQEDLVPLIAFGGIWGEVRLDTPVSMRLRDRSSSISDVPAPPHAFLTIAADGELHNREDLLQALGISGPASKILSDRDLILASYEKWGSKCTRYLLGEYAFAIWDQRRQRLFLCRDHVGLRPLFYWRDRARLVFASDLRAILNTAGVPRQLNQRKLASMSQVGGQHFYSEDTFHQGVTSLAGASWLEADRAGVRIEKYWEPEISSTLVPRRPADAFEALRELLFQAVRCRMPEGKRTGALLSGGLDSSTLVSIAARSLAESGDSLTTLSSVLADPASTRLRDEREFIDEFRSWPNINLEYISVPGRGPFDTIDDTSLFELSPLNSSRSFLYGAFHEAAQARGIDVLLDGEGGEYGPTCWGHGYYAELALGLRWSTLARELALSRPMDGASAPRILGRDLARLLRDPFIPAKPSMLLAGEFARQSTVPKLRRRNWPDQRRCQLESLKLWMRKHACWGAQPAGPGVRFSRPMRDKRVLEFCISAPGNLKVRDGYSRYLVRGAMEGVLPKKIQWRTDKIAFSPDYYPRFNAQLPKAREFIAAIRHNDPVREVVDVESLSRLLTPVPGLKQSDGALSTVPSTIYLICFLRQFAAYRA
jgi:asparagine synthase (glutamine-hydrolysing)